MMVQSQFGALVLAGEQIAKLASTKEVQFVRWTDYLIYGGEELI